MFSIALIYGLLAGAITIGSISLSFIFSGSTHVASLEWLGYLVMILALSLIFFGVKRYRDRDLGGVITFGNAFMLGMLIAVIAGFAYVIGWEVYLAMTDYAFISQYSTALIAEMTAQGATEAEIADVTAQMNALQVQYADPLYRLPITFLEIFPVGLLVTIVAAVLLRNPRFMPAPQT